MLHVDQQLQSPPLDATHLLPSRRSGEATKSVAFNATHSLSTSVAFDATRRTHSVSLSVVVRNNLHRRALENSNARSESSDHRLEANAVLLLLVHRRNECRLQRLHLSLKRLVPPEKVNSRSSDGRRVKRESVARR